MEDESMLEKIGSRYHDQEESRRRQEAKDREVFSDREKALAETQRLIGEIEEELRNRAFEPVVLPQGAHSIPGLMEFLSKRNIWLMVTVVYNSFGVTATVSVRKPSEFKSVDQLEKGDYHIQAVIQVLRDRLKLLREVPTQEILQAWVAAFTAAFEASRRNEMREMFFGPGR